MATKVQRALAVSTATALFLFSTGHVEASPVEAAQSAHVPAMVAVSADAADLKGWLQSAEAGNVDAMNDVGVLYLVAFRTAAEHATGLYWLQRAIDGGSVKAMHNLGWLYVNGSGVPRDYANALVWFKRAAGRDSPYDAYIVAMMAEHGLGGSSDLTLARTMYRRAADAGIAPAMAWISEDLAQNGELVEAYAWLHITAQSQLDERLQIVVLARLDKLTARLAAPERDAARAQAARIADAIRSASPPTDSGIGSLRQSSPRPAGQVAIRWAEANSGAYNPLLNVALPLSR